MNHTDYSKFKDVDNALKNVWEVLEKYDELGYCVNCGKKIWKYWHRNGAEMRTCAPCYFGHGKKNISHRPSQR